MRCVLNASLYKQNSFITNTYDEGRDGYHNKFQYSDIQEFKRRLRRYCEYHFNKRIQVYNVHEYGKNGKKHWHLVVFNHDFSEDVLGKKTVTRELFTIKGGNRLYTSPKLQELWPHGHHTIGEVTEASAMYQSQYMQKDFQYGHAGTNKKCHSKHSGIGRDYFLANYEQILKLGYIPFNGRKAKIPRYFERIAHKHYSHFYEPSNFHDTNQRKKLYTPFKDGQENRVMADLYKQYNSHKQKKIIELSEEWQEELEEYIFSKEKMTFQKSAENQLYDLKNRTKSTNL